ncbi:MAG TPA: amidohydrolase family protein [Nitrososphaerales archaeon]|nr:amidohydrolase family protein [Nitrososphaerales archaeon]
MRKIIDFHNHYFPKRYFRVLESKHMLDFLGYRFAEVPSYYDMELRREEIAKMGVDLAVLSLGPPGVDFLPPKEALRLAKSVNDELASIVSKYPNEYLALATLPLCDVEASLTEFDRCIQELGMKGVIVFSNVKGKLIASEEFYPIFERAQRYDVPVLLHPAAPVGIASLLGEYRHPPLVISEGFLFDSTLAISRLIFDGTLEKYSKLKIVLPHLGSVVPYILSRIDIETRRAGDFLEGYKSPLGDKKSFASYFSERVYVDTVSHQGPAYNLALEMLGRDKLLLGSDYPYSLWEETVHAIEKLGLSEEDREAIYSRNAERLLKI